MTSGMRKAPPISTSSPRDTTASLPCASALSVSNTAAALLLTMVAAMSGEPPATSSASRPDDQIVAVAAPAGSQVVLKRARRAGRIDHGGDGFLGQLGAAEIGVQYGAGQVEDGAQIGPAGFVGTAADGRRAGLFRRAAADRASGLRGRRPVRRGRSR